ncbi:hypothetical protein, partial [Bacteriovorax sp. Seq25_V]|uniref:hypothetical protein n=1 Tax=Bacteriovorax sp. Seq25_V TaxID=1201288 RepID=UPI00038A1D43
DTAAPVCTISTAISGNRTNASETINFSCSDANNITIQCKEDGGVWGACDSSTSNTMGPTLSQGAHSLQIRATDAFYTSTIVSRSWVTDSVPPSCSVGTGPGTYSKLTSESFTYSCADTTSSISSYECKKDSGAWISCGSSSSYSWSGITEGAHTFSMRAKDASGLYSSVISWSFTSDFTAPSLSISSSVKQSSTTRRLNYSGSDPVSNGVSSGLASRQCRINSGSWSSCSSTSYHDFNVSTPGAKTYDVLLTDNAGNTKMLSFSETVIYGARTSTECTSSGGTVVGNVCQFSSAGTASCPVGWSQYNGYAEYASRTCGTSANCNTSCTASALSWTSSASQPSCTYQTGTWSGWNWTSYGWASTGNGPLLAGTISQNTGSCPKSLNAHIDSSATYPYDLDVASDYCALSPNWTTDGKSSTRCRRSTCNLNCTSVTSSVSCTARLSKVGCN